MASADSKAGRKKYKKYKRHQFVFALKERVVIVTDRGRCGVIERRRAGNENSNYVWEDAYLVVREYTGQAEWYPALALAKLGG